MVEVLFHIKIMNLVSCYQFCGLRIAKQKHPYFLRHKSIYFVSEKV
jgi:hypothetical protein